MLRFRSVVAVFSALLLTSCSAGTHAKSGGEGIEIGLAISSLDSPFFLNMTEETQKVAAELGVSVVVANAHDDAFAQVDQIRTLIARHVRAIIINPVDSQQATQAADLAQAAHVPLVSVDRAVYGGDVSSEVASDNVQGGALGAIELGRAADGDVVHLKGNSGVSVTLDRGTGFDQGLNSGGVTVVARRTAGFSRSQAFEVMKDVLRVNPGIRGVFADNDEMALGAIQALGVRAGREVQVVGFDGTQEAVRAVEAGTMAATVAQQPDLLARSALEQAVKLARGHHALQVVDVPVKVVTKANAAEFHK